MTPEDVQRLRKRLGLTQAELAALAGVHEMTVSRWERGTVTIREHTAKLLRMLAAEQARKRRL